MGAGGTGTFDNEDAVEWIAGFGGDGTNEIEEAFENINELDSGDYIEADVAAHALAAAEVVAAARDGDTSRLPDDAVETVRIAGLLHDIGKNGLPMELLVQPTPLTPPQRRLLQGHVAISLRVLQDISFPWPVLETIAQHHERLDGSGYPQGLADGAIRQGARILAVADTIEAMSHARPYRSALPIAEVEACLAAGRGRLFDAAVVDAGLALLRETPR